jgi:hypothetical protein
VSGVAQTNLQLYNQVLERGWRDADVARLRDAYVLAFELFSAMSRPSGKVFVSHLVGTASVLAAIDERPAVVAAGLLHAAYTLGEFGDGTRGMTPKKRSAVRTVVGTEIEELVAEYARLDWHPEAIPSLVASRGGLDAGRRDVVVMRLANEVDDWTDGGLRYAPSAGLMTGVLDSLVTLSDLVDAPKLGHELRELGRSNATAKIPQLLVQTRTHSYAVPPCSYRPRFAVVARRVAERLRVARIRRVLRRWPKRMSVNQQ